jgi:hypothetical protein
MLGSLYFAPTMLVDLASSLIFQRKFTHAYPLCRFGNLRFIDFADGGSLGAIEARRRRQ